MYICISNMCYFTICTFLIMYSDKMNDKNNIKDIINIRYLL